MKDKEEKKENPFIVVYIKPDDHELINLIEGWREAGENISRNIREILYQSIAGQIDDTPKWALRILRRLDGVTVEERQAEVSKIDLNGLFDDDDA